MQYDQSVVTFVAIAIVAALAFLYQQFFGSKNEASRRVFRRSDFDPMLGIGDAANQLRIVMASDYSAKRIMNFSEFLVFKVVEAALRGRGGGYRVFSQTALGEILHSQSDLAHRAVNAKRVDVLIVAANGFPVSVLEYQGKGHYQGDAAARDAIKREALRKAGIAYIEILEQHGDAHIRQVVGETLDRWEETRRSRPSTSEAPSQGQGSFPSPVVPLRRIG